MFIHSIFILLSYTYRYVHLGCKVKYKTGHNRILLLLISHDNMATFYMNVQRSTKKNKQSRKISKFFIIHAMGDGQIFSFLVFVLKLLNMKHKKT